jgi:hypothetical protein
MKIETIHTGQLASMAGVAAETIELPDDAVLGDLVAAAVARHGSGFGDLLCGESGGILPTILVAVDGVQATGEREQMPLGGVREVMFMAPVAGG